MKLEGIEPIGEVIQIDEDFGTIKSEVIQGVTMLPVGTQFYTAEQMQEYAKAKVHKALKEVEHTTSMNGYIFSLHIDSVVARTFGETDERTK